MRAVCPSCGAVNSLDAMIESQVGRDVTSRLGLLAGDDVLPGVVAYLALFRAPGRSLTWSKVLHLLDELVPMVAERKITHRGRTVPASTDVWSRALRRVLDRRDQLALPLTDHGYLLTTALDLADKAGAEAERAKEQRLRARPEPVTQPASVTRMAEAAEIEADLRLGLITRETADEILEQLRVGAITPEESAQLRTEARAT